MPNEETIDKIHYSFNDIKYALYVEREKRERHIMTSPFIERNLNIMNKEIKSPKIDFKDAEQKDEEEQKLLKEVSEQYKQEEFRTFLVTGDESIRITAGGRYHYAEIEYNFITGETTYKSTFLSPTREQVIKDLAEQKLIQTKKIPYTLFTIIVNNSMLVEEIRKQSEESKESTEGSEGKGTQRKRGKNVSNK